jgi:hypothetical protein
MIKATLRGATMWAARRSMPLTAWSTTVSMSAIFHRPLIVPHLLFLAWGRKPASPAPGHQRAINAGKRRVLKAIRGLPAPQVKRHDAEPPSRSLRRRGPGHKSGVRVIQQVPGDHQDAAVEGDDGAFGAAAPGRRTRSCCHRWPNTRSPSAQPRPHPGTTVSVTCRSGRRRTASTVNSPGWHAARAHDYPHDPGPVARPPMPGSRPVTHQRFHQAKDQPTIVRTCAVSHARRRLAAARRQIDPCGGGTS